MLWSASAAVALWAGWSSAAEASIFVSAANPGLTPIALLTGGRTYEITATGVANLLTAFNNGIGATFTADGKPTYTFTAPLESFNPNGSNVDPQDGGYGVAGAAHLFGELVGTFSAIPTSYAQLFTIGTDTFVRPSTDTPLFAIVNDDYYPNNDPFSGYSVSVTAVPLPASLPAFGIALVVLGSGAALSRRRKAA